MFTTQFPGEESKVETGEAAQPADAEVRAKAAAQLSSS